MCDINKIIRNRRSDFDTWEQQQGEHLLLQYQPEAIENNEERERIFFQTNDLLTSIAQSFFRYIGCTDTWDTSKCSMIPSGQYILIRSEKMDIVFNWGFEWDEYFLETYIMYPENLRFMKDNFWDILIGLKKMGKFEYAGGGGLNREQKPYFENKTSAVFQIIRTFMLNQNDRMNNGNTQWEYGSLVLKWEADNDWEGLLEWSCKAFELMYQLNYQLWKVHEATQKQEKDNSRPK